MKSKKKKNPSAKEATSRKGIGGRPSETTERLRDYRGNLLLDAREEAVFKAVLGQMAETEGRRVSGAELLRRLVMPFIRYQAIQFKLPLNPSKPADVLPVEGASWTTWTTGELSNPPRSGPLDE